MLTGGSAAENLYNVWSKKGNEFIVNDKMYFIGDERCVGKDSVYSNYNMIKRSLLKNAPIDAVDIMEMRGYAANLMREIDRYSNAIPEKIDILLLSVGEDGHIASLFPNAESLNEMDKSVVLVSDSPKLPSKRMTITQKVIRNAKNIIVMVVGEIKGKLLVSALKDPENFHELPVRLTIGNRTTWVLDEGAAKIFKPSFSGNLHSTRIIYA